MLRTMLTHDPPTAWTTAPLPTTAPPRGGPPQKWGALYEAVRVNSDVPLATVLPLDDGTPYRAYSAVIRRALKRRAEREGLRLHTSRRGSLLYLWLSLPPEEGA